jgi:hypothetical protein
MLAKFPNQEQNRINQFRSVVQQNISRNIKIQGKVPHNDTNSTEVKIVVKLGAGIP